MSTTPTPWIKQRVLHVGDEQASVYIKRGPATIAAMNGPCLLHENVDEDADLIVRAVNAHAALVAALEGLVNGGRPSVGEPCPDCDMTTGHVVDRDTGLSCMTRHWDAARAALALATGE